jgi:hypothetical protein
MPDFTSEREGIAATVYVSQNRRSLGTVGAVTFDLQELLDLGREEPTRFIRRRRTFFSQDLLHLARESGDSRGRQCAAQFQRGITSREVPFDFFKLGKELA